MAGSLQKMKFWKPGTDAPVSHIAEERSDPTDSVSCLVHNTNTSLSIDQQRQRLPVFRYRSHILYLVERYPTVIIIGETGSGKSTQIPQYLLEAGWAAGSRVIAVTQPRRVAAITVASRVAEERGSDVGREIGYAVRFDDSVSSNTRVKFLTDGLLVREMMSDPLLSQYSVVMLDEAHERTVQTDVVIGLLRKIQKKRKDLKIIVASATLDAEAMYEFFNDNETGDKANDTVAALSVEGRMFPVDLFYSDDPVPDYTKATIDTVMAIHTNETDPGDVLAFLTGQEEVESVVRALIDEAKKLGKERMKMRVLPMYAGLSSADQMRVFERTPRGVRKIVIATNLAETSITIDGVVYVIDCGFVRTRVFNPRCGVDALLVVPTSQASADQRAGRAGRVRSGKAYRLYTEESFAKLSTNTVPEMQRINAAPVILQLKALGIDNVLRFKFLSPPPAENVVRGLELLYALGAIDDAAHLTSPLGLAMAELPLPPMFARIFLASGEYECSEEVITVAAMAQIQNYFITSSGQRSQAAKIHRKFSAAEGDHVTSINVYNAFVRAGKSSRWCKDHHLNYKGLRRAVELCGQLIRLAKQHRITLVSCGENVSSLLRCLTVGLFANAAKFHPSGVYRTIRDDHVLRIHPTSVLYTELPPDYVLFGEVVHTKQEYMRDVSVIKAEWLYELVPHYYQFGTQRELVAKRAKYS